jgi:hypothetical protein
LHAAKLKGASVEDVDYRTSRGLDKSVIRALADWRHPLLYVQADTVVRWQREWFHKFWARLSNPQRQRRAARAQPQNSAD